jgi:hypothetical protein
VCLAHLSDGAACGWRRFGAALVVAWRIHGEVGYVAARASWSRTAIRSGARSAGAVEELPAAVVEHRYVTVCGERSRRYTGCGVFLYELVLIRSVWLCSAGKDTDLLGVGFRALRKARFMFA